jgi:hypothetical protein
MVWGYMYLSVVVVGIVFVAISVSVTSDAGTSPVTNTLDKRDQTCLDRIAITDTWLPREIPPSTARAKLSSEHCLVLSSATTDSLIYIKAYIMSGRQGERCSSICSLGVGRR